MKSRLLFAAVALLSSGCGGGGGGAGGGGGVNVSPGAVCDYIAGGGTTTLLTPGCPACSASNEAASVDGNPDTYAAILFPALASGDMALRATAQNGIVYPAGSHPGAIISGSSGGGVAQSNIEIRLYFQGALVGSNGVASINGVGGGANNARPDRVSYTAPVQFDAVEIGFYRGTGPGESTLNIHEFCSN